ncbi:hypothetical protein F960_01599 [Acinetobacter gerneri DSM 14967 = CIP 107464 = MTCC 9824]|uniref:Uncharacterized protein n=1 Tax=Acinetobacter gerneri DSM 14967 = CIP 107464 = MTCC 9824 TaxID=1120926 RepID=N8ZRZ6_9GAMM|nr:hypothetical protein F960_01599 [Acinetobacter gerneri DSM 14967 = CIP 107464 = MTCC 9824]
MLKFLFNQFLHKINTLIENSPYLNQESPKQIGEKGQTAENPNPPKPNRFPHALRLDGLDYKRFIFIVDRVESRSARKR